MWLERISRKPELVAYVAENMREWDEREIFATRWDNDKLAAAKDAITMGWECGWTAGLERPIAAVGGFQMWPGVFSVWLFATDEFGRIGISMTKAALQIIIPACWASGAHRIETRSMEGHHDAQRWLEFLGARRESTQPGFGRKGEDFHTYVWDKP